MPSWKADEESPWPVEGVPVAEKGLSILSSNARIVKWSSPDNVLTCQQRSWDQAGYERSLVHLLLRLSISGGLRAFLRRLISRAEKDRSQSRIIIPATVIQSGPTLP